jgi:hypothetical protein
MHRKTEEYGITITDILLLDSMFKYDKLVVML